jgi:hypothetical protein
MYLLVLKSMKDVDKLQKDFKTPLKNSKQTSLQHQHG